MRTLDQDRTITGYDFETALNGGIHKIEVSLWKAPYSLHVEKRGDFVFEVVRTEPHYVSEIVYVGRDLARAEEVKARLVVLLKAGGVLTSAEAKRMRDPASALTE